MAISQDLPDLTAKKQYAAAKNTQVYDHRGDQIGTAAQQHAADPDRVPGHLPLHQEGRGRDRGRALLRARRHRLQRLVRALVSGPAFPAAGPRVLRRSRAVRQERARGAGQQNGLPEVPRGRACLPAREGVGQGQDPHPVPEHHLLRRGRLRRRGCRPHLLRLRAPGLRRSRAPIPAPSQLRPEEAALLAGIISSPSAYSPRVNPTSATTRRNIVLQKMDEQGMLLDEESSRPPRTPFPRRLTSRSPRTIRWRPTSPPGCASRWSTSTEPAARSVAASTITPPSTSRCRRRSRTSPTSQLAGIEPTASVVVIDNDSGEVRAIVGGNDFDKDALQPGHQRPPAAWLVLQAVHPHDAPSQWVQSRETSTPRGRRSSRSRVSNPKKRSLHGRELRRHLLRQQLDRQRPTYSDNSVYAELGYDVGLTKVADTAEAHGHRSARCPTTPPSPSALRRDAGQPCRRLHAPGDGVRLLTRSPPAASAAAATSTPSPGDEKNNPRDDGPVRDQQDRSTPMATPSPRTRRAASACSRRASPTR